MSESTFAALLCALVRLVQGMTWFMLFKLALEGESHFTFWTLELTILMFVGMEFQGSLRLEEPFTFTALERSVFVFEMLI